MKLVLTTKFCHGKAYPKTFLIIGNPFYCDSHFLAYATGFPGVWLIGLREQGGVHMDMTSSYYLYQCEYPPADTEGRESISISQLSLESLATFSCGIHESQKRNLGLRISS